MNKRKFQIVTAGVLAVCLGFIATQGFTATPKEIYQKAGPAVVFILAADGSRAGSVGTGSIIRNDGLWRQREAGNQPQTRKQGQQAGPVEP